MRRVCKQCVDFAEVHHDWEGRLVIGCSKALLSYCNMFDKLTKHTHGKHCTAYKPNAAGQTPVAHKETP